MNTGKRFVFFFTASKIRGCWGAISKGGGGGRSTQMEVWHEGRHKIRQRFIPDLGLKCWLIKSSVSSPVNLHPYYFLLCYNVQSLVIMLNSSYWIIFAIWFGFERIKMQNVRVFTLLSGPIYTSVRSVWQKYTQSHISCQADTSWWWQVSHTCSLM